MGHGVSMANLVWGEGPVPCEEMVIGEAPGEQEDQEGRPFVGAAGSVLVSALRAAGIEREQVYITNAYKHRPEGNRNPTKDELDEHARYLCNEVLEVDPRKVLLLGRVASDWVGALLNTKFERGSWQRRGHRDYYHAYHPAATIYNRALLQEFNEQVYEFFNS